VRRVPGRSIVEEPPRAERTAYRERIRVTIATWVEEFNSSAPVVLGLDWGHTNLIAPLPVGAAVTVVPETERLVFN
jgi:muramoyltetrapeptide carboxypeptidase LdcA involved in peptidoglycan recycling